MGRLVGIATVCLVGALGSTMATSACVLPLRISCGDGWVDREAGEECDPADPRSFEDACAETSRPLGRAFCDPVTCELDVSIVACAVCGDGIADRIVDEDCDGNDFAGQACDSGHGQLQCTAECEIDEIACERCGNGGVDAGEECDPKDPGTDLLEDPPACAGDEATAPLPTPAGKPYASGEYVSCDPTTCFWNRTACTYCGDGIVDAPLPVDWAGHVASAEVCDGDAIPEAALDDDDLDMCAAISADLRPNVVCDARCGGVEEPPPLDGELEANDCCIRAHAPCPTPGSALAEAGYRCCYEYAHPEAIAAGEDACGVRVQRGEDGEPELHALCRPVLDSAP